MWPRRRGALRNGALWGAVVVGLAGVGISVAGGRTTSPLVFELRDSVTGVTLPPDALRVRDVASGALLDTKWEQSASGVWRAQLPAARYEITADAKGHGSMGAEVEVDAKRGASVLYHLDPDTPPEASSNKALRAAHRPDAHIYAGYVVDGETGQPLAGALVMGEPQAGETFTDASGFFCLPLPVSAPTTSVRVESPGFRSHVRLDPELFPSGDSLVRIRLAAGRGTDAVDERTLRHREGGGIEDDSDCDSCSNTVDTVPGPRGPTASPGVPPLPKFIRVGRNCPTRTTCTSVEVYTVDTYCKHVLPAEWYSCWGNVAGGMDSLKAGAVAVRSYGVSFVYAPATQTYDICDSTSCQVFGNATTTNANIGVDQTSGYVLLTGTPSIARSEYSAENNNNGCGDGWAGTGSSWPCIADPICTGFADNGHGRGLCQWGSARWATGRRLSSSQACTSSAPPTGYGTKNWLQLLAHYYPTYTVALGGLAVVTGVTPDPVEIVVGNTTQLSLSVQSNNTIDRVLLGASIAPTGTSGWVSFPAGDRRVTLLPGSTQPSRPFAVSASEPWGWHDVWTSLYYDLNNNNLLDAGDFLMEDLRSISVLNVRSAITVSVRPPWGRLGQGWTLQFTAHVTGNANTSVQWSIVSGPGSINTTGLFTASTTAGGTTYVRATSVADPTRWAEARVFTIRQ